MQRQSTLGVAALAFLLGCSDFLSTEPRGQLTTPSFFTSADQAVEATNATYGTLRDWGVHVFAFVGMTDIVSDDATKGSVPADASFLQELDDLNFSPGNGAAFGTAWAGYYGGIYRANVAIQNIPSVPMDEALKARLLGENKFLRAYFYFFLVRAFGGVPLITAPLQPDEYYQPRASADAVYAQIVSDLEDAIAALPQRYGAADVGRATQGAARALLGKAHLYRGDYEAAYAQLSQVIQSGVYDLYPTYRELWSPAGENSGESVFEVLQTTLEQRGGSGQYAQVQGIRGTPNVGWGFNTPSADLEASYEPGDPRLQTTILYPWEALPDDPTRVVYLNPSMPNNRYNQKAYTHPDTPGGSDNSDVNIRRIRYADVLLMAAEAAYRTGREDEARGWLNQVRARARDGAVRTVGTVMETLAPSIAQEVLGRPSGSSRAFVRYVSGESPVSGILRPFDGACREACGSAQVPPVRVASIDIVEAVNGVAVMTAGDFQAAVDAAPAGAPVEFAVTRLSQAEDGTVQGSSFTFSSPPSPLLPDVVAGGEALLQAIWRERRSELAMEQHRWFDVIRQGRAQEVMAAVGKTFVPGRHELFPVPNDELLRAGLTQNPGY